MKKRKKRKKKIALDVDVFKFKPSEFHRRYGKKTKAVSFPVKEKDKVGAEIHIRKSLPKTTYKSTLTHEFGHAVTEKAKVASRLPQKERVKLRKWAKEYLAQRGVVGKREAIREMLAVIYQKRKLGNQAKMEYIRKNFPAANKLVKEAIERVKLRYRTWEA